MLKNAPTLAIGGAATEENGPSKVRQVSNRIRHILGLFTAVSACPFLDAVPEPDPVFDTVDLNATYVEVRRIFQRMNLSPKDIRAVFMTVGGMVGWYRQILKGSFSAVSKQIFAS